MDVLTPINAVVSIAQRLKQISDKLEDAEFKNIIAELMLESANAKLALAQITEENAELQRELTKLKHSAGSTGKLTFKEFAYYSENGDGPFCPGCYDTEQKQVRLSKLTGPFTAFGSHSCPSCKESFGEAHQ